MNRIVSVLAIVLVLVCACSRDDKPATSDLKKALSLNLPGHVSLDSFSVDASQNLGNKVEPLYAVRFQAAVKTMVDLYKEDRNENGVKFVSMVSEKGKRVDIFGKITSCLYQGAWRHNIQMDGNPFAAIGIPLTQFSGGRVVVLGSDDEKKYRAEIERKETESRQNLANAGKLLIGTWRDENSLITYKPDGTRTMKADSGNIIFSRWHVDGDLIIRKDEWIRFSNGKQDPLDRSLRVRILYIDKDRYTVKDNSGTWNAKRIN